MNEKTARQITEMKKQTIGVEVEMNNITRQKAAKAAAEFFRHRTLREYRRPQRIQHLVGLGRRRARVEVPEGCFHCGTG